jgi:hypothetical protein
VCVPLPFVGAEAADLRMHFVGRYLQVRCGHEENLQVGAFSFDVEKTLVRRSVPSGPTFASGLKFMSGLKPPTYKSKSIVN